MEAFRSSRETNTDIISKVEADGKGDNNESSNNNLECNEDGGAVHQKNTSFDSQEEKQKLNDNSDDGTEKEHSATYGKKSEKISDEMSEQEQAIKSSLQNQGISDDEIKHLGMNEDPVIKTDLNDAIDKDALKLNSETENSESTFHSNLPKSSFNICDGALTMENVKSVENNLEETEVDFSRLKQPGYTAEVEDPTVCLKNENEKKIHDSSLKNHLEQSIATELQTYYPRMNGNHKVSPNSLGQENEVFGYDLEVQKTNISCETYHMKKDLPKSSTANPESEITKNNAEAVFEKNLELETQLILNTNGSRCTTPDSVCSSSSAHSSSSQQLVIDQPADEDKITPLRLTIKRKQSQTKASKRLFTSKKSNTRKRKEENLKNPILSIVSNVVELESRKESVEYFSKSDTVIRPDLSSTTKLAETSDMNDSRNDAPIELQQCLEKSPAEELLIKSTESLSCDRSEYELNSNLCKCPVQNSTKPSYYKCTTCGTYHEIWSFFLHIREQHDRFLCLYCIKLFPTAEKLSLHLEIKHDLEQNHFNSEESFRSSATSFNGYALETRYLMCCTCQHVFNESVTFTDHICMEYMKSCVLCGQKGRHTNQCKAHPFVKRRNKKKVKEKLSLKDLPSASNVLEQSFETQATSVKAITHNEDSNSSSNMVIDESCTTNHSVFGKINAFDKSEESEYLEKPIETPQEPSPRQTVADHSDNMNISLLKLKLRVPKEFQKPVDAVMSSSESDDGILDENTVINCNPQNAYESLLSTEEITAEQQLCTESNGSISSDFCEKPPKTQVDDESESEEVANPNLARIIQEIEQTKLDIERTKETIRNSISQKTVSSPKEIVTVNTDSPANLNKKSPSFLQPVEENIERNWTPTPPASPKTTPHNGSNEEEECGTSIDIDRINDSKLDTYNNETALEISLVGMPPSDHQFSQDDSSENTKRVESIYASTYIETKPEEISQIQIEEQNVKDQVEIACEAQPLIPTDGIEVANEDCLLIELQFDKPMEKYEVVELVRTCLKAAYPYCLYCNHARRIAVNGESLVLHLIAQHRFSATVDSITAEELRPETLVAKLKSFLSELRNEFFNTSSYCTIGAGAFTRHFNERIFECFQCRFVTTTHKELYLHNRKMHLRTAILCFMCRCNFFSFSEILCHICPGVPHKISIFEIKFRCCLCDLDNIPSPFRLMVHLRKRHFACDICLEDCRDQSKLSSHVWKHKLHHLCYRCGIAYRNKMDITKHLFWKHGTESAICKRCLNKRWPHVYHFCVPPQNFVCDVCQHCFTKAMYLTVHKRIHLGDFRYPCTEENCEEKFISRKLLLKHAISHQITENVDFVESSNACDQLTDSKMLKPSVNEEPDDVKTNIQKNLLESVETQKDEKIKQGLESREQSPSESNKEPKDVITNVGDEIKKPLQKKKKKKRAKESLEDLNLTAPNLSESGSSSDSESETKSKHEEEVSKIVASPRSENGEVKDEKLPESVEADNPENVLDIWKNFLQAQQANSGDIETSKIIESEDECAGPPKVLHVCYSDHDYCKMFYPAYSKSAKNSPNKRNSKTGIERKRTHSALQGGFSSRNSNVSSDDSGEDSSNSSTSSSCSCGSNCSCSDGSSSSSSSSSSENSDSSAASRKRQRKKLEYSNRHRKSESISPRKNHMVSEVNVAETNENPLQNIQESVMLADAEKSDSLSETFLNESDLETAESETDEEYYDEHPQKLASELLSQKRAQLMARTFLSPSHHFDIVENSRPSTPSLPEDVVYEKRKKKKKRERKSSSKSNMLPPKFQMNVMMTQKAILETNLTSNGMPQQQLEVKQNQYLSMGDNLGEPATSTFQQMPTSLINLSVSQQHNISHLGNPRISEGSSCSDLDASLKRSKRARRPNKFYGYTSDDESMGSSALGQSLLIGMRTFKPQPPPQLVWHKEDLPTPSKSKKISRTQKRHESEGYGLSPSDTDGTYVSLPKKKKSVPSSLQSLNRKKSRKLPPIPRLKIRPSLFGMGNSTKAYHNEYTKNAHEYSNNLGTSAEHDSSDASSDDGQSQTWKSLTPYSQTQSDYNQILETSPQITKHKLPIVPTPLPPTPQTTVFNHKIPPALLPNPDFTTLQYFKANNIRYPIRPPAGARAAREGESVYCYCRCPYDEVSEMIACDGDNCLIEWFHFECVGIMVAPQGKWFCAECRPHYSEDLYPQQVIPNMIGNKREH